MKQSGRSSLPAWPIPRYTDATLTTASETELRRRASEGNGAAFAELTRRRAAGYAEDLADALGLGASA